MKKLHKYSILPFGFIKFLLSNQILLSYLFFFYRFGLLVGLQIDIQVYSANLITYLCRYLYWITSSIALSLVRSQHLI